MSVLVADHIEKVYADRSILRGADLRVEKGERVGLVGPNGCGKSTFLKIMGGVEAADGGAVRTRGRLAILHQNPVLEGETVADAVAPALAWHKDLMGRYQAALESGDMVAAGKMQDQLDTVGWEVGHKLDALLHQLGAPPRDAKVAGLSGGERRRVALARALMDAPDILLLDEPTNHLDAETIDWLQDWLLNYGGALVVVTHDRYLLEAVATRIVEIDDGVAISYDGSYADFLIERAERRAALQRAEDSRLAMIRHEAEWASRSPAARSTKQKARLERLDELQAQRPLKQEETFALNLKTGLKTGQTLLEMHGISKRFGDRTLFRSFDLSLLRGERIGVLGPNGAGKSTLMNIIAGRLEPSSGHITVSPKVKVAMLDQHRTGLKLTDTVFDAAGDGNDQVKVGGEWVHVAGFLKRFMFPSHHQDQLVSLLSGGERARLLLARMMLQGANLLLLDEPTNDLDLMTLRVLEEALLTFDGSAIIITHDRAFLDRVCTSILKVEEDGTIMRYESRLQVREAEAAQAAAKRAAAAAEKGESEKKAAHKAAKAEKRANQKRMSYKDKKELEAMPGRIEELEQAIEDLEGVLADPATYRDRADEVADLNKALAGKQDELAAAYDRWEELEALAEG